MADLVHRFVDASAARDPDRVFVVDGDTRATYAEVAGAAGQVARLLARLGIARGDRVALLARNSRFYVEAYYGILGAGAIAVPVNTAADAAMLGTLLADAGATALMVGPGMLRLVSRACDRLGPVRFILGDRPGRIKALPAEVTAVDLAEAAREDRAPAGVDVALSDRASIIYTSGSTGAPRGAVLSHANLVANARAIVRYLELTGRDRVLAVLPFYYVYGKSVLNTHALAGGEVVIENRFQYPAVALDALESHACTGFSGVPSTFAILLERTNLAERELPALRYVTQAGGAMSPALTRRLIAALHGVELFVMYGATEASARLAFLPPAELDGAIGSIGRAIDGVTLTVTRPDGTECDPGDVGELVARGPNIMEGYWNAPDETAKVLQNGAYLTGDLARRDDRGLLYIVGRTKQMVKAGGHRISPQEIEDALCEHEAVAEAAVIGVKDDLLGEQLKAFVVPRAGASIEPAALAKFLGARLPAYKVPRDIEARDDLPRNESGKVMKSQLS